ncbi:MAG: DUF177 domain-containing protein [Magnetococcus sp. MYC-9]
MTMTHRDRDAVLSADPLPAEPERAEGQPKRDLSDTEIDLRGVRRLTRQFRGVVPAVRLQELSAEVEKSSAADVVLAATFTNNLLRLQGTVHAEVERVCARCLVPFATPLQAALDRLFVPGPDPAGADSQQEMVVELTYLEDYRLPLRTVVEEELLLALPMIPLCQQACAGLCATCGVDRNREPCHCEDAAMEGPFAVLKNLTTN